ncbi:MAG: ROK family protein [Deltaproteobacteria bacterium]|nr:ROK family protein [Deltaproteobacteria bacterium]
MGESKRTLAIDIGGTGLKMLVLDPAGKRLTERARVRTPRPALPDAILDALMGMVEAHGDFERVSCGFPGVVHDGVVKNAPNLHPAWGSVDLAGALQDRTGRPARVCNDADVQGYAVVQGQGVELVVTLGTGFGSALFVDGKLVPNLELGHHPFRKGRTYEEAIGKPALQSIGKKRWNRRLAKAIPQLARLFNYRRLYLGGGHARLVRFSLPENAQVVSNEAGLLGGIALWRDNEPAPA